MGSAVVQSSSSAVRDAEPLLGPILLGLIYAADTGNCFTYLISNAE